MRGCDQRLFKTPSDAGKTGMGNIILVELRVLAVQIGVDREPVLE